MFKIITDSFTFSNADIQSVTKHTVLQNATEAAKVFIIMEIEEDSDQFHKIIFPLVCDICENTFLQNEDSNPEEKFEQTLKEVNQQIGDIQKNHNKKLTINALLAVTSKDTILLSQSGKAEAYLLRKNKLNVISDNLSDVEAGDDLFVSIASGEILDDDTIILSNSRLLRFLTSSQLASAFHQGVIEGLESVKDLAKANEEETLTVMAMRVKMPYIIESQKKKEESIAVTVEKPKLEPAVHAVQDNVAVLSLNEYLRDIFEKFSGFIKLKKEHLTRRELLLGIFTVIVLLTVAIGILRSQNTNSTETKRIENALLAIQNDVERAKNLNLKGEKAAAITVLDQSEKKLNGILNVATEKMRHNAILMSDEIAEAQESINNIVRIKNAKVLADLSEKRPSIEALGLISFAETLYAFEYNALYKTILNLVEHPLTINDNEVVIAGSAMEDRDQIVFYTKSGKVIEYRDNSFSFSDTKDDIWAPAIQIATFRRYLYLLDPSNNQIWKYERRNDMYSAKREYIQDENVDIADAISFSIDGTVYILKQNREITALYAGKQIPFEIKELPNGVLDNVSKIFTQLNLNHIYLLDSVNNRVVVLEKPRSDAFPRYKRQYMIENMPSIIDLYVDQGEQHMYLLDKQKVYEITL